MNNEYWNDQGLEQLIDAAYDQGWNSHQTGIQNPYNPDTEQSLYLAWEEGKEEAARDSQTSWSS